MNEFDKLVNVLLEAARCTKVTGQQQSTRKDKKYMRCAKVDGKLKRVHYGDPNLRIKKSNPKNFVDSLLMINSPPSNSTGFLPPTTALIPPLS